MEKVVVIGCGGHAKVVIDVLLSARQYNLIGFLVPYESYKHTITVSKCIGTYDGLAGCAKNGINGFIVAIGDNALRQEIYSKAIKDGLTPINAISPFSYVSKEAQIGKGNLIVHGSIINPNAVIEDNCIINTKASIDHDCYIASHSHICPGATLAGAVIVQEGVLLGTGSSVLPGIFIGKWATCGAGSVVTKNVEPYATVVGVPSKKAEK